MKMFNCSLVLVTAIQVGSGPHSSSFVSAQCPNQLYQQFPYLDSLVPANYKWWEPPEDVDPIKITLFLEDSEFWKDELGFFQIFMKMRIMWKDRRLFTSNMTRKAIQLPVDGSVWVPKLETNWISEKPCSFGKSLQLFQNGSLTLSYDVHAKKR